MRGAVLPKRKTDSSDNTKVAQFFHPVVSTKKTDKLVETRTGDDE